MIIVAIAIVFALTACNNSAETEPTPEPTPTVAPESTPEPEPEETPEPDEISDYYVSDDYVDVEAYVAAMNEFIWAFEELTVVLFDLIDLLDYIEEDEDLLEWIEAFETIKHAVALSADELTSTAAFAPEEYMDSHILIAAAVSLIFDSMVDLDHGLAAAIMGDYDTFWAGIEGFVINILAADMLWAEAVGSPQHDPVLFGTWGWEEVPEWAYTFNSDGTGLRVLPDGEETFLWETEGNELWLNRGANIPQGELQYEHWRFSISGDILTIESMQVEDVILNYIRQ